MSADQGDQGKAKKAAKPKRAPKGAARIVLTKSGQCYLHSYIFEGEARHIAIVSETKDGVIITIKNTGEDISE